MRISKSKAESIADWVYWCTGIFFVFACLIPPLIIALIGLFTGTAPTEAQGGIYGHAPGYPAFNPQSWLLYIPAISTLFLAIWTIPLPLRSFPGLSRRTLTGWSLLAFIASIPTAAAFSGAPGIANEGALAVLIFLLAWLISLIRQVLGWFKLVPQSWREAAPKPRRTLKKKKPSVA